MRDRLIELLEAEKGFSRYMTDDERRAKLADHLIENGVVVPPCKVGDKVYQINKTPCGGEVYELDVFDVSLKNSKPYYETESIDFDDTAIGRSIFLTREEAEQALAERGCAE